MGCGCEPLRGLGRSWRGKDRTSPQFRFRQAPGDSQRRATTPRRLIGWFDSNPTVAPGAAHGSGATVGCGRGPLRGSGRSWCDKDRTSPRFRFRQAPADSQRRATTSPRLIWWFDSKPTVAPGAARCLGATVGCGCEPLRGSGRSWWGKDRTSPQFRFRQAPTDSQRRATTSPRLIWWFDSKPTVAPGAARCLGATVGCGCEPLRGSGRSWWDNDRTSPQFKFRQASADSQRRATTSPRLIVWG